MSRQQKWGVAFWLCGVLCSVIALPLLAGMLALLGVVLVVSGGDKRRI